MIIPTTVYGPVTPYMMTSYTVTLCMIIHTTVYEACEGRPETAAAPLATALSHTPGVYCAWSYTGTRLYTVMHGHVYGHNVYDDSYNRIWIVVCV